MKSEQPSNGLSRLLFEVAYRITYHSLNRRFYARISFLLNLGLLCSAVLIGVGGLFNATNWALVLGLALAMVFLAISFARPGSAAQRHAACLSEFLQLSEQCTDLDDVDLQEAIHLLKARAPKGLDYFVGPSFNRICQEFGQAELRAPVRPADLLMTLFALAWSHDRSGRNSRAST